MSFFGNYTRKNIILIVDISFSQTSQFDQLAVDSHMSKKLVAIPLLVLILLGCSSGGSTEPDVSSNQAITDDSITESNSESSTTLVPQSPSRDTVLAVNRCIKSSSNALRDLNFFFTVGEIPSSYIEAVQEAMKLASTDCEEAALQAKTDGLRQLTAGVDHFLRSVDTAELNVQLFYLALLSEEDVAWDQVFTDSFRDALGLFLKTVFKFGITPNVQN